MLNLELNSGFRNSRHLIGVSGGRDSVALLHELHQRGWRKLVVCHVNHQLRGRASAADAAFVRGLAKRLGYAFETLRANVPALASEARQSIETCARNVRHEFFAAMAAKHRCKRVLLAHHAEDQAETVLMRVLRGSGIGGLAGMETETPLTVGRQKLTIVRPMLHVRRAEIDRYITAHHLKFREDETNASATTTRNRVRLALLPLLKDILDRDVTPALLRLATIATRDDDFLSDATEQLLDDEALLDAEGRLLIKPALKTAHSAIQHRVMHHWLQQQRVSNIDQELIEQAVRLITQTSPAKINLPQDRWLRRKSGMLWIEQSH